MPPSPCAPGPAGTLTVKSQLPESPDEVPWLDGLPAQAAIPPTNAVVTERKTMDLDIMASSTAGERYPSGPKGASRRDGCARRMSPHCSKSGHGADRVQPNSAHPP